MNVSEAILLFALDPGAEKPLLLACEEVGVGVLRADDLAAASRLLGKHRPRLVVCGFEQFKQLRETSSGVSVVLVAGSGNAQSEHAIEGMKQGALDYLIRPFEHAQLVARIRDALRISRDMHVPAVYEREAERTNVERIVGQSPAMQEVYKLIGLIAPRDVNVLITGESGTGKELVARAIYHHSARRGKPFLAVNCAAIPESLLESEMFGHEKGAFTGAESRRIGKFEQCHDGILLLDEIGDMPLATQAKLLRVLQDNCFQRLGGTDLIRCDVRIIAATNQPLERLLGERRFREDLYYRLKVATIHVPPLREREVDVVLLAHAFVKRLNPQLGSQIARFSPEVLSALLSYDWPGNVRELENVIKGSLVVARGSVFRPEFLPPHIRQKSAAATANPAGQAAPSAAPSHRQVLRDYAEGIAADPQRAGSAHADAVGAMEREIIRACLVRTNGMLTLAARMLGMTRTTLRKKIAKYGIQIDTQIRLDE
jgi:DNA-binding NtrC family response regulator